MTATPVPEALAQAKFPGEILEVLRKLKTSGFKAYFVGGLVRDRLSGKLMGGDFDVATNARAEQVQKLFRRVIPTGLQHGTVTVLTKNAKAEVTTFRGEGAYADGRRPDSVVFLDDVKEDLARRDFTMNAMAFDPIDQEFVDPFGGAKDLEARLIRCVGKARDRFSEDGLRPLRAVRFASVLGFDIEPETLAAIPATLATFNKSPSSACARRSRRCSWGPSPRAGCASCARPACSTPSSSKPPPATSSAPWRASMPARRGSRSGTRRCSSTSGRRRRWRRWSACATRARPSSALRRSSATPPTP
ncbi:MAG: hypothetical protein QM765_02520 [Myxococcales bacterium]